MSTKVETKINTRPLHEYDFLLKVVIVGDSGVGKSCLLKRFATNEFNENHYTTIGVDFEVRTVDIDGKAVKLQLWDTAGQERFRTITSTYYRGAHAILLVYDVCSASTFQNVSYWLNEIRRALNSSSSATQRNDSAVIVLVGNKADCPASQREVSFEEGSRVATEMGVSHFMETSAKSSLNVTRAFMTMAQSYVENFASLRTSTSAPGSANSSLNRTPGTLLLCAPSAPSTPNVRGRNPCCPVS